MPSRVPLFFCAFRAERARAKLKRVLMAKKQSLAAATTKKLSRPLQRAFRKTTVWSTRTGIVGLCTALAVGLNHGPAAAQAGNSPAVGAPSGIEDSVELKSGAFLRGMISEFEPGSHLTLILPGGTPRRFDLAQVERATRGGKVLKTGANAQPTVGASASANESPNQGGANPTTAESVPSSGQENAPAKAAQDSALDPALDPGPEVIGSTARLLAAIPGPRVTLKITANRGAMLQRQISVDESALAYSLVCRVPCTVKLPTSDKTPYRIGETRLQNTDWFQVPPSDTHLHANLVSHTWNDWPTIAFVGALVVGTLGALTLGANELWVEKDGMRIAGFATLGVAGGLLLTSGGLALFGPQTKLESQPLSR